MVDFSAFLACSHVIYIMPQYPTGCSPPIGRGELGGAQTWIRSDYWSRLEVRYLTQSLRSGPAG